MDSVYLNIFYIFIVLAAVFAVLSILLFIRFNIIKIIGDLTGSNYQKEIKKIRANNEKSGIKEYKVSKVNQERGKITGQIDVNESAGIKFADILTEDLHSPDSNSENATVLLAPSSEVTTVLDETSSTVLSDTATTVLGESATTVLAGNDEITSIPDLSTADSFEEEIHKSVSQNDSLSNDFVEDEDLSFTESNEIIV